MSMRFFSATWKYGAAAFLPALLAGGCAKSESPAQPRPDRILGYIQFEGEPFIVGDLELVGESGPVARTPVLSDGTFQFLNVPEGEYRGVLYFRGWPVQSEGGSDEPPTPQPNGPPGAAPLARRLRAIPAELSAKYNRVSAKYEDAATSDLACRVKKGLTRVVWTLEAADMP
jgi:hypothetical protein